MDFSAFTTITFDCYGTLIDWEAGILPALRRVLSTHKQTLPDEALLELYGEFEAQAESGAYQSYRNVLESVVGQLGERCGFRPSPAELRCLHESVPAWPPFPDAVDALQSLAQHYQLAVISNIDDDLFSETRKHLGVEFAAVITALVSVFGDVAINAGGPHCSVDLCGRILCRSSRAQHRGICPRLR